MALDKDSDCIRIYNRNFRCLNARTDDITAVLNGKIGEKPTSRENEVVERTKHVTLLLAGPPCQGNSDLNNRTRREDPRNALYERVARFVELSKPEHVLIENVPTAIHGKEGAVQRTIRILRRIGYAVDSGVVDLSTIGVPQKRRRHVLVASISKKVRIRDVIAMYRTTHSLSVKWAIGDLQHNVSDSVFEKPARHTNENKTRIRYLYENNIYELPNKLRPLCHRNGRHSYKSMYGRLRAGMPAQTITSGFGSPGQGRFIHPTKRRTLTPHEAARLQFFPDFFDFSAVQKKASLASMIGNAAPMKLSYVFALELLG
jgi:DNA (cytosine-5)-methyltransferase 1